MLSCLRLPSLLNLLHSHQQAGKIENYLVKALTEYRSEARKNETMNIVSKELSDEDINNISAYYASIQIDVIPP